MKLSVRPLFAHAAARMKAAMMSVAGTSSRGSASSFVSLGALGDFFRFILKADDTDSLLAFSAIYACVALIAGDISKLRIRLMSRRDDGETWAETDNPAYSPVLRKPNKYQTRIQFLSAWVTSKLLTGNTYILKQRDNRGVVVALHILDSRMVTVLVADNGDVYYQLASDYLAGISEQITIPASEVIHDRAVALFHPLIGVGPIYAAGISASQGRRIQANSAKFFENMSRPGGVLTAPGSIDDETAARLKADFEKKFQGDNMGRLLVAGDGLKYEPIAIPAAQAQMIEQLKWTGEDSARAFLVPLHKIGLGAPPTFNNMAQLNQDYFNQALHPLIESIELLLDEGLGLTGGLQQMGVELDVDNLLRMDPLTVAQTNEVGMKAGYLKPNEARATRNLAPVDGGDSPYMQQQNWPLAQLAARPAPADPSAVPAPAAPAAPDPAAKALADSVQAIKGDMAALGTSVADAMAVAAGMADQVKALAEGIAAQRAAEAAERQSLADAAEAEQRKAAEHEAAAGALARKLIERFAEAARVG